jgi:hypothetical protein
MLDNELSRLAVRLLLARLGDDLDLLALKDANRLLVANVGHCTLGRAPAVRTGVVDQGCLDSNNGLDFAALAIIVRNVEVLACNVAEEGLVLLGNGLGVNLLVERLVVESGPRDVGILDSRLAREADVDTRGKERRDGAVVLAGREPSLADQGSLRVGTQEALLGSVALLANLGRHDDDLALTKGEQLGAAIA